MVFEKGNQPTLIISTLEYLLHSKPGTSQARTDHEYT